MLIGGAEDKVRERVILTRFVALAGGQKARIVVVTTASIFGAETGARYRLVFEELGAGHVETVDAATRADAQDPAAAAVINEASGIFLAGGNQLRLSSIMGGTSLAKAISDRHGAGIVVAGTSAGASALSTHMIAFGRAGASPRQRMTQMGAGLGLLPGVVVDQHFLQRNRLGRLLSIVAQNPSLLGLGIDEDTAAVVSGDQVLEVIGRGSVTIIDGSAIETNAWKAVRHLPLMITNAVLHVLPAGYRFDLQRRVPLGAPALRAIESGEAAEL